MAPKRRNGEHMRFLSMDSVIFTALGVVIGNRREAFQLARLQIMAYHLKWYTAGDMTEYPVFHFMLRILADYLKEPSIALQGAALKEPISNALFDLWRDPNTDVLIPVALAACDMHTWRTLPDGVKNFNEFSNGECTNTPIEILLLFKLRQLSGLHNPQLDHPLMNTPLGQLPDEVPFQPDDLIQRVRTRMESEGFDEVAIATEILSFPTPQ